MESLQEITQEMSQGEQGGQSQPFQASAPGNASDSRRVGLLQLSSLGLGSGAFCTIPISL